jgi:hypothetical protein
MEPEKACDFCSTRPVVARHKVDPRGLAPWEDRPARDWFACDICHDLIVTGDVEVLAQRAALVWTHKHGGDYRAEMPAQRAIQEAFWACDAGEYEMLAQ